MIPQIERKCKFDPPGHTRKELQNALIPKHGLIIGSMRLILGVLRVPKLSRSFLLLLRIYRFPKRFCSAA